MANLPSNFTLLQVVPELDTGGVEQTALDVSRAVTDAGGRSLVASRGGRMEPALKAAGGELVRMPAHAKDPVTLVLNAFRLAAVIRREKVDLIHVRSRAPAFSALWAARLTGTPLVATYHGVYSAKSGLKRWYNRVMTRGDLVIANSDYTREHLLSEHPVEPDKVIAIPRGVDLARYDPAKVAPERLERLRQAWGVDVADKRTKVLLAGRLTRWKGQLLLIEAAARAKAAGQEDFLLLLAGDSQGRDAYVAELHEAVVKAGLQKQVRLVGHCEDMPAAYLLADVAAAPSLQPEAFGRTAVEPQVMGRPVLAADHGAARETVAPGETGWLVNPRDPAAWGVALREAIEAGPKRRAAMGKKGRERATSLYSVKAMTDATLAAYARALKEARA